jgi:hypothetical protein
MEANLWRFFTDCLYVYNRWIFYLLRGEACDSINRFNSSTFLCLFGAMTWISNVMCCDYQKCKLSELIIDLNKQDKLKMGYILIMGGKNL